MCRVTYTPREREKYEIIEMKKNGFEKVGLRAESYINKED